VGINPIWCTSGLGTCRLPDRMEAPQSLKIRIN
jgi:hypothetical protein